MRMDKSKEKHTNIYPYVHLYIHIPTDAQTYINTGTNMRMYPLGWCYAVKGEHRKLF